MIEPPSHKFIELVVRDCFSEIQSALLILGCPAKIPKLFWFDSAFNIVSVIAVLSEEELTYQSREKNKRTFINSERLLRRRMSSCSQNNTGGDLRAL